jgi:anaerobic ribonucleoside-triphosphate reductase activating protein
MKLTIAGVVRESIVDGKGIRYTVFTQGCPHHCPGCHNPQTWPFTGGQEKEVEEIFQDFQKDPILKGITFSGGEPFCQPEPLTELARMVHGMGKDVTVFTGWTYEQLLEKNDAAVNGLLQEADVLIDGPFLQEEKNLELTFRGSENQRVIDLKKTRQQGQVVLLEL